MVHQVTRLFPLWALLGCMLAYLWPEPFLAARPAIVPLLALVMFGMGLTLTTENFREVLRRPELVALGVGLQFLLMPLIGWLLVRLLGLPPALAAGVILVGSCPGGTASNVVCYLARGDVALSIEGSEGGVARTYGLTELLPADANRDWPFSFRYFQDFDRQILLPDGFAPERVHIEVRSKTRSVASIEETFAWAISQG